jgi:hypothetical protein
LINRKNQNSILFLTTLGVYLGLLVVGGAAPQVFAHSATTRNFELVDEIEVKDDLDTNPDDCSEKLSERARQLLNLNIVSDGVIHLVADLNKLVSIGKLSKDELFGFEFTRKVSGGRVQTSLTTTDADNPWARLTASENIEGIIDLLCPWSGCQYYRDDADLGSSTAVTLISISLNSNDLVTKIATEQKNSEEAIKLASIYNEAFAIGSCSEIYSKPAHRIVYQNTKASFSQSQVFIVTRLPRAGLDALLAKNAK